MKNALATGAMLVSFSLSASAQSVTPAGGGICDPGKAAVGVVIGVVVGTLIFPGIGTALGASLGGGGTCAVEFAWSKPPRTAAAASK